MARDYQLSICDYQAHRIAPFVKIELRVIAMMQAERRGETSTAIHSNVRMAPLFMPIADSVSSMNSLSITFLVSKYCILLL